MYINSGCIKHNSPQSAFTLFELLVVVSILIVILLFAIPIIFQSLIKTEAINTRYTIERTINEAKAISFSHNHRVHMCLLDAHNNCNKNADEYLILFVDKNQNNLFDEAVDRLIVKEWLNLKYAKVSLRAGRRHYVRFARDSGTPRGFFGHFKYCPTHSENSHTYQVSFNQVGNIRYKPNDIHPTGC